MSDHQDERPLFDEEPPPEGELGDRLRRAERALYGDAPDDIRAAALRARLLTASRPSLARLAEARRLASRQRSWWEHTAGWSRAAIPAGIAAAIAATLLVIASRSGTAELLNDLQASEQTTVVAAVVSGAQTPELAEAVIGPATREWLINAAFASVPSSDARLIDSTRP